jgi:hypothetical protein
VPTRADLLMQYLTFVAEDFRWRLHEGIGSSNAPIAEREGNPVFDFSAGDAPVIWVIASKQAGGPSELYRLRLPELERATYTLPAPRLGAVACAPDGEAVAVLALPGDIDELPAIWVRSAGSWQSVTASIRPDISSKLAWIAPRHLAFESSGRRLTVLDLDTSAAEEGPEGCCVAAATRIGRWFALSAGTGISFSAQDPFKHPAEPIDGVSLRDPGSLRVTADGEVFTWTQSLPFHRVRGYVQKRGSRPIHFPTIERGSGGVVGPYP